MVPGSEGCSREFLSVNVSTTVLVMKTKECVCACACVWMRVFGCVCGWVRVGMGAQIHRSLP